MVAAGAAFFLANSSLVIKGRPVYEWYHDLWHIDLGIFINGKVISKSMHHTINNGLMSIFFVDLEIKRELLVGELASFHKSLLPNIVAAIGGMVCPALVYSIFNAGHAASMGWGIPMATDIAFSAGVLGLLSKRVPSSLGVFLIAFAIVDDLGSVTVIALFYTEGIALKPLIVGLVMIGLSFLLSRLGVRNAVVFTLMFIVIWVEFFQSGVHATIAGVLFAFTIPADARYESPLFVNRVRTMLSRFHQAEDYVNPLLITSAQQNAMRTIEEEYIHVEAPLQRIENKLHPICAFIIMPIFAFANSGVHLDLSSIGHVLNQRVTYGVFFGLLIGKQLGIMSMCWITIKMGFAELPKGVSWSQIYGVTWLAGIGFTMSIFIGSLAFPVGSGIDHATSGATLSQSAILLSGSKIGTLMASIVAGIGGVLILFFAGSKSPQPTPRENLGV